jgi:predicted anti-sigma-YlaC factor YlaD
MNCKILRTDLFLYAEGSLPSDRMKTVESHLEECEACRIFSEYLQESLIVIAREKESEHNPFLSTRILTELESVREIRPLFKRKWVTAFAFVTLLILAVIGGINLGKLYSATIISHENELQEEMSYIDDLEQEPIEMFFMTDNNGSNE